MQQRRTIDFRTSAAAGFRELGLEPRISEEPCLGDWNCHALQTAERLAAKGVGWDEFQQACRRAELVFFGIERAVDVARDASLPRGPEPAPIAERLRYWALFDQIWRGAMQPATGKDKAPPLDELGQTALRLMVMPRIDALDRAHTEKLKAYVQQSGWPGISQVGEGAATDAFLIVQHAAHDPLFQYQVLKLMQPMLAQGDVAPRPYAFLYDRVMLFATGRQRYGSQFICRGGAYELAPLEDETNVEDQRRQMGLPPLQEYRAMMPGRC